MENYNNKLMENYNNKLNETIFKILENKKKLNILELGVRKGISTKKFLKICLKNGGHLYSVDIADCSKISSSKKWTFIQSRDDNYKKIKSIIPKKIDVLFIDTLHEANHVKKIFYAYYNLIKINGFIFIDDISHLPYISGEYRENFYCEINNKETFIKILEIYNSNKNKFILNFNFQSSGMAIIQKKSNKVLSPPKKIYSKNLSIKNLLRMLWNKINPV